MQINYKKFKDRRSQLIQNIKTSNPSATGHVLFFANLESKSKFRQESSFYYFTGITEPSVAISIDITTGYTRLHIPRYSEKRTSWTKSILNQNLEELKKILEIDSIECFSDISYPVIFSFSYADSSETIYKSINNLIEATYQSSGFIYTVLGSANRDQVLLLNFINSTHANIFVDISDKVGQLRRIKDEDEIENISIAVVTAMEAHSMASGEIKPGVQESFINGIISFCIKQQSCNESFETIVASGPNSVIIHYKENDRIMQEGDLVIIDLGADMDMYCSDMSRTYPVSGKFSQRQAEIVNIVGQAQKHIASLARPGYWLFNPQRPEKSLHHLAVEFFKSYKLDQYFKHKIGHYVGLDVHDVGSYSEPLQQGDIITIEPGLYIEEENIGVRIEDMYLIDENEAFCFSEDFPKMAHEIENLMENGPIESHES